jgi:membrane protease YdiL (CAAX protease family)
MTDEDADGPPEGGRHGEAAGGAGPGRGGADAMGEEAPGEAAGADAERSDELSEAVAAFEELAGRPAAAAGLVAGAFMLVASTLPWTQSTPFVPLVYPVDGSTLGAAFAAVATGIFFARRHGVLDRTRGAILAGVASEGVVLLAVARFLAPATGGGSDPVVGVGLPLALVAGTLSVGLAIADEQSLSGAALVERARRTGVGFGLMLVAFVVMFVIFLPLSAVSLSPAVAIAVGVLVADVGFASVAVGFLAATGRGWPFVDLEWPDLWDVGYMVVGFVALVLVLLGLGFVIRGLGLPSTSNNITSAAQQHPETLLVLIPLQFLLVAPAEELLSRNVIQKYLYGSFSRYGAVVVGSLVFASAHYFSYIGDSVVATAVSLTSVFLLSLLLGALYERTENILVPIVSHGAYNALLFLLLYIRTVYGGGASQQALLLPW